MLDGIFDQTEQAFAAFFIVSACICFVFSKKAEKLFEAVWLISVITTAITLTTLTDVLFFTW